uniref:Lipid droplet-regulating VLDL assembly factor AUP1 n=1 Tax=Arion vulgaris TaxID=1028688 RepID=A0A0B7AWK7_9EUPU
MLSATGLPISVQGVLNTDVKKKILVSNHVTNFDPFILTFLHPNVLVLDSPNCGKNQLKPSKTFDLPSDKNRDDVLIMVKEKIRDSEEALLFFPEKLKTNGKTSLLKFSQLPFDVDCPIQPITIQVKRFFFDISVSTFSSSTYEDLIWCLILPLTLFKIKYLPVTERKRDETREEFATRFQSNMAKSLGLTTSSYSHHDVTEYIKKKTVVNQEGPSAKHRAKLEDVPPSDSDRQVKTATLDLEMERMVRQVKDVLPDTPTEIIVSDLKRTRDVDTSITNILEGKVEYSKPNQKVETSLRSPEGLSFKATKFEINASARQLSFAERKQAMLEAARLIYRSKNEH